MTWWPFSKHAGAIMIVSVLGLSLLSAQALADFSSEVLQEHSETLREKTVPHARPMRRYARKGTSVHEKENKPGTGAKSNSGGDNDAAYFAYDQGQYLTALKLAKEAAGRGSAAAHTLAGRIYAEGRGVAQDFKKAADWYARGAKLGDVNARFSYGLLLVEGRGVKKDWGKAAEMFEKAAMTGHAAANYNLGLLFLSGKGKPENPYRGAKHIEYAAQQGIPAAQYELAGLYLTGTGVPNDALQASTWLSRAANAGMGAAQFEYAVLLLRGLGLKSDAPRAIEYLLMAAKQGIAGAQNRLAHVYAEGAGVEKNLKEAAKWSLIAKSNGMTDLSIDKKLVKLSKKDRQAAEVLANEWAEKNKFHIPDAALR